MSHKAAIVNTKQYNKRLEQEKEDLEKEFKKNLSEKVEENSCLRNLNQKLLEQIKGLKEEKADNRDMKIVEKSVNGELLCVRNHNQILLTQIGKLKNDKKLLENNLDQLIQKEASKFSDVKIQVVEKGTNTYLIHITTQEGAISVEVRTTSDVGVQTMVIPSVLTIINSAINKATPVHEEDIIPKAN
jgi:hypothetical protein